jgi:hypothetical protein
MTATIIAMEFLPVDKVPAHSLMVDDHILVDGEIVLVTAVMDGEDDTIIVEYADDYDEVNDFTIDYDAMISIYMLFD